MTQTQLRKAYEERLDVGAGRTIFVRSWRPETSSRGVVVIVPGFNSNSGYYGWAAEQLVAGGLSVDAVDLRRRGQSDGERFYDGHFHDLLNDLDKDVVMADIKTWIAAHVRG